MCACVADICVCVHYTYMKEVFEDKPAAGVLVLLMHVFFFFVCVYIYTYIIHM